MLTRIENECKYFHRDSLIFFLFFFCVGSWKISFSNFFSSFRISSRVDWKSSRKVETNTTKTTNNKQRFIDSFSGYLVLGVLYLYC